MPDEDLIMTPKVFGRTILGYDFYPKQEEVLDSIFPENSWVSYLCCNNGGKTSRVITTTIAWHLAMWPKGKVKSTSGSWMQIIDQLRPSLAQHKDKFPQWNFFAPPYIDTPEGGFWRGFSTKEPGRAEGDHADGEERPLLFIVDEAKTVPDVIFMAVERCVAIDKPIRVLVASSPGFAEGYFFKSQTTNKKYWKCFKQTADDTPHISKESIHRLREKWVGFPSFAASMLGEAFMPLVEDALISLVALDYCLGNPIEWVPGDVKAFCDFAWSNDGDENVFGIRNGNRVTLEDTFHADNLPAIVNRFINNFKKFNLRDDQIGGDEGGGGKLIMDALEEKGWFLNRVNNGAKANDDESYANWAAETWMEGSKLITANKIILPQDEDLRGQLLSRKRIQGNKGRLCCESKRDMKGRGVPSPDRADTVLECCRSFGNASSGGITTRAIPMRTGGYQAIGC